MDTLSRHFHYIVFDEKRNILIATLGDGIIVRVAILTDRGSSWRPLYKGSRRFMPVFVEENRWVFGFDSGTARDSVAMCDVNEDKWRLFPKVDDYRHSEFTSKMGSDNYHIGYLERPVTVLVLKNLLYSRSYLKKMSTIGIENTPFT